MVRGQRCRGGTESRRQGLILQTKTFGNAAMRRRTVLYLLLLPAVLGGTACSYSPRYADAPPYGYEYYYYPNVGVYFHLISGDYYYRDRDHWSRVRVLPPSILLDHRLRRTVVIKEREPYHHFDRYREEHRPPPGFRPDPRYDRPERDHNRRRHEEYRKRWEHDEGRRYPPDGHRP